MAGYKYDGFDAEGNVKGDSQVQADLAAVELEMRELDLEIKRATVAKIRAERANAKAKVQMQEEAIQNFLMQRKMKQRNCNHRKGGVGAEAVLHGRGQSAMYCVIKHKLPVGKYWVLCQRCGKEWHPELTAIQNGGLARKATKGYYEALQFPTNNSESGSSRFDFVAAGGGSGDDDEEGE